MIRLEIDNFILFSNRSWQDCFLLVLSICSSFFPEKCMCTCQHVMSSATLSSGMILKFSEPPVSLLAGSEYKSAAFPRKNCHSSHDMPGQYLSSDLKERICKVWEENQTISYSKLAERFSVKKTTAYQLIKRYKERGSFEDAKKTGRPRATSKRTDRRIVRESKQDPFKCAT